MNLSISKSLQSKYLIGFLGLGLISLVEASFPVKATSYECITLFANGNVVCIHSVYSYPGTSIKVVTSSVNGGRPTTNQIDCARPYWEFGSIYDRVCSYYR